MIRLLLCGILFFAAHNLTAKITVVRNDGDTFKPDSILIMLGDTVNFNLEIYHDVLEVSKTSWDSNYSISNSGLQLPFGGGLWIPSHGGVFYYVCEPHADEGMKGRVFVIDPSSILEIVPPIIFNMYPTSVQNDLNINFTTSNQTSVHFLLFDFSGRLLSDIFLQNSNYVFQKIDCQELPSGEYFFTAICGDQRKTLRFIKIP